jgi:hypothetical protein
VRTTFRCALALLMAGPACQGNTAPTLLRIEPSVLTEGELPMPATIFGQNLRLGTRLSLDDESAAELAVPRVSLNGVNAAWVTYRDSNQLAVMLPSDLSAGVYDVAVLLDPQHPLVLPGGLHVLSDGTASTGGEDSTIAGTGTRPEPAGSTDLPDGSNSADINLTTGSASSSASSGSDTEVNLFRCGPGEFGPPELVALQGYTGTRPWSPTSSTNYGAMYFTDASSGTEVLWYATRGDRGATYYAAPAPHSLFATGGIGTPYVSANGLSLYFYSTQVTGFGGGDLYLATRPTTNSNFSYPFAMTALNSVELDYLPWVSPDELTIVFVSQRTGASAYYTASRATLLEGFGEPTLLPNLTHTENNGRMAISADGLRAYFTSRNRPGGVGLDDVWYATRGSIDDDFADITNLTVVNTTGSETEVTVTQDGEELYFILFGTNNSQLYRSLATCNE